MPWPTVASPSTTPHLGNLNPRIGLLHLRSFSTCNMLDLSHGIHAGNRPTSFCLAFAFVHAEKQLCPLFNCRIDRVQQSEKVVVCPPPRIALILFSRSHLQLSHMAIKRRGGHLQRMDPLRRGIYDLLLRPFYSGAFSLHFISSHPLPLSLLRHNPRQPYILIPEKNTHFNRPNFQSINRFGK